MRFVLFGLGYIGERHLQVMASLGHELVGVLDPHDRVGILDRYFPECRYFPEPERFDRWLHKLPVGERPKWATVASPNWLHDAHCRMAMRAGCDVICEKPVVVKPWNVETLIEDEADFGKKVHVVHQLRFDPSIGELRRWVMGLPAGKRVGVRIHYCVPRGPWYRYSWKGNEGRSGGILVNLGIHLLDLVLWIFGPVAETRMFLRESDRASGRIETERASVDFYLSTRFSDSDEGRSIRSVVVGDDDRNWLGAGAGGHEAAYVAAVGNLPESVGVEEAGQAVTLAHVLRTQPLELP